MAWWLLGCVTPAGLPAPPGCDPRELQPGEVRAKQVGCADELIDGGEGRVGDWVIENAVARFVVRGTYAPLTELEGDGGTLVDAAAPGGRDLLVEYRPDGDRSTIEVVEEEGAVALVSPGVTWRLPADSPALQIVAAGTGRLVPLPGVERTGATLDDGEAFLGFDGEVEVDSGTPSLREVTRVAVDPEATWPDGEPFTATVDADRVVLGRDGRELRRLPVVDGVADGWAPPGAEATGERDGCVYAGLEPLACGTLMLRVQDQDGRAIRAVVTDGVHTWTVPDGGGRVPAGPEARLLHVGAGPAFSVATLPWAGGDATVYLTLFRELDAEGWALVDVDVPALPDPDSRLAPWEALTERVAWGVDYAVVVADDEVPAVAVDPRDPVLAAAGSRAGGGVWSWPWSPNGRRAAHGAVPWQDLGALDQLTVSQGGESAARHTVVTGDWVEAARAEGPPSTWSERPDLVWLASPEDLPVYLGLLDDWVDVAPVAATTWAQVVGARNGPAVEAALLDGRVSAGNGPRLSLAEVPALGGQRAVTARVEAPHWMVVDRAWAHTSAGARELVLRDGVATGVVPPGTAWVVVEVRGRSWAPWLAEPAWAVSGPLWLDGPG